MSDPPDADALVLHTLTAALRAVEAGDRGHAVALLAEVWSATRSERVERLVLAAGVRHVELPSGSPEHREQAWARAWAADPPARTALAGIPWPIAWRHALLRVEAMYAHPDPRTGDALAGVAARPYLATSALSFWRRAARVLGEQGGARHVPLARAVAQRLVAPPAPLAALLAYGPPPPQPATPAREALLDTIERKLRLPGDAPELGPLLDAVYASPDDDDARRVYADALAAAGDPRGEFIQLQLAMHAAVDGAPAALSRRANALLRRHEAEWVEGVGAGLLKHDRVFERGFLVGGTWDQVDTATHPAWRLVQSVTAGPWTSSPVRAVLAAPMPSLRRLYGVEPHQYAMLLDSGHAERLTHLGIVAWHHAPLPPATRFPRLVELSLKHTLDRVFPVAAMAEWPTVSRWVLRHRPDQVGALVASRPPAHVTTLVNGSNVGPMAPAPTGWVFTLERATDGTMGRVRAHWGGGGAVGHDGLAVALSSMRGVESLEVQRATGLKGAALASAEPAMRRLGGRFVGGR